jgi:hypothetical protein
MFYQEATQSRAGLQAFIDFDQERFDRGTFGMGTLTWARWILRYFGYHAPIYLLEKRTIALHERVMHEHPEQALALLCSMGVVGITAPAD